MKKVLVIYHYYAHYRLPIINELLNNKEDDIYYSFLSGDIPEIPIKILNKKELDDYNIIQTKNIWFSKKILWQKNILKYSLTNEYDSIIFLGSPYFISTWIATLLARIKGKKTFFWTHGFIRGNSLFDKIRKMFFKIPNGLLLYGNKSKDNLIKEGFDKDNLFVIYNSLDYKKQLKMREELLTLNTEEVKKELFQDSDLPILLFIGRLTKQKKLTDLLKSVNELHKQGNKVNLLIIGKGEEEKVLKEMAKNFSLENYINFYGASHNEQELAPLIYCSDICVAPGEVGLTAMHSLTYGTPVISHDNYFLQMPEYEAIIDYKTGFLYKYNDFNSLVNSIKLWITSNHDRDDIRKNCYQIIDEKYNPQVQVKLFNQAILGLENE